MERNIKERWVILYSEGFCKLLESYQWKETSKSVGMSMQVERASVDQAKQRYEVLKNPGSYTEQDLDEGILKQQQEEEERKRQH
ncbi:hypothetical protein SO802_022234 [Lithocarpus litseifolius]|uniref:Uncharacterized protein n=1 Tax=Lithocarpus litseifolius TaxID=425828 RepID=A0AAW2CJ50_9ROSI